MKIGIDVGGTFTDGVLCDNNNQIIISHKTATTRPNPIVGLRIIIAHLLNGKSATKPDDIEKIHLSTTLATNAVVEGHGANVGLISIGQDSDLIGRAKLDGLLEPGNICYIAGGHNSFGDSQQELGLASLEHWLDGRKNELEALAVNGLFSIRNPAHEEAVRSYINAHCKLPVTCGHELTSALDASKRVLTNVLNARLIPSIARLMDIVEKLLPEFQLNAPLMIVRGDGSIISSDLAKLRPIETILSGPAAGLIGAYTLSRKSDAMIADVGGTTLDIGMIYNGLPTICEDGASVAGYKTRVRAVAMQTFGLGGDSMLHVHHSNNQYSCMLGPNRAIPIGMLAGLNDKMQMVCKDEIAHQIEQHSNKQICELPLFLRYIKCENSTSEMHLSTMENRLLAYVQEHGVVSQRMCDKLRIGLPIINSMIAKGIIIQSGLTPTDCLIALNKIQAGDRQSSIDALGLLARKLSLKNWQAAVRFVLRQVTHQAMRSMLISNMPSYLGHGRINDAQRANGEYMIAEDLCSWYQHSEDTALSVSFKYAHPIIGIGAPAKYLLKDASQQLGQKLSVPLHGNVANALGAAVAKLSWQVTISLIQLQSGLYRIIGLSQMQDFTTLNEALERGEEYAKELAIKKFMNAYGNHLHNQGLSQDHKQDIAIDVQVGKDIREINLSTGDKIFVEARIDARAVLKED